MKKILIPISCLILIVLVATIPVLAYIHRVRQTEGQTTIGTAKVISITNTTTNNYIPLTTNAQSVDVSIELECNIDATIRVKVAPRFYDPMNKVVILENFIIYGLDDSLNGWVPDSSNMCFYYNGIVKNLDSLTFLNSIAFDNEKVLEYSGYSVELIVEVDILQHKAVNYDNHPWRDNAPQEWIDNMKNL